MKTEEAQKLAAQILSEVGKRGESDPDPKTIALALGGVLVNLARIADSLEARNEAQRQGTWDVKVT